MADFALRVQAHAKINLYLDVIGKRPDEYHEIETVFHSIGLHDDIYLRKRADREITVHCEHPHVPCDPRNLAYRAAKLLVDNMSDLSGIDIKILKRIPVAAGLGGGSADAAAVLCGMNALFDLGLTQRDLMRLGVQLGADVPFCILGGAALGQGIGEILTPLPPFDGHVDSAGKSRLGDFHCLGLPTHQFIIDGAEKKCYNPDPLFAEW